MYFPNQKQMKTIVFLLKYFMCDTNTLESFNLTLIRYIPIDSDSERIEVILTFLSSDATIIQEYKILENGSNVRSGFTI